MKTIFGVSFKILELFLLFFNFLNTCNFPLPSYTPWPVPTFSLRISFGGPHSFSLSVLPISIPQNDYSKSIMLTLFFLPMIGLEMGMWPNTGPWYSRCPSRVSGKRQICRFFFLSYLSNNFTLLKCSQFLFTKNIFVQEELINLII